MHLHRIRRGSLVVLLLLSVVAGAITVSPRPVDAASRTFTRPNPITISSGPTASPYPAPLEASGLAGVMKRVTVTLKDITFPSGRDLDIMVVAPTGQQVMLFSDVGTGELINATLTFSDDGLPFANTESLSDSQTVHPTNVAQTPGPDDDVFPAPAPAGTPATTLEQLSGKSPSGVWKLFVRNDGGVGTGSIAGGWEIFIETAPTVGGNAVTVPTLGAATPYASTITMAGGQGINRLRVTLFNVSHTNPDDLDILLVGPGGQKVRLMSDAGGATDIVNATLSFVDNASKRLPDQARIIGGLYKPSNFGSTDVFPAPAPAAPYSTTLSVFRNTDAGGTWSLYVTDDLAGFRGSIGGWALSVTPNTGGIELTEPIGNQVVHPGSTITRSSGFSDPDGDSLELLLVSKPAFVSYDSSSSGISLTMSPGSTDVGTHTVDITVSDGFHVIVHTFTIVVPEIADLAGPITLPEFGEASPYPSSIVVSGMDGVVADVTVAINAFSDDFTLDADILLVDPIGQAVELLSDCSPPTGLTFTFSDAGAAWDNGGGSGTYQPTDCNADADTYPSPAPGGSPAATLSAFVGGSPNGTWSLYIVDDEPFDNPGSIASWSLNVNANQSPTLDMPTSLTMDAGDTAEIDLVGTDPDGDALDFSISGQPSFMTLVEHGNGTATLEVETDRLTSGPFSPTISLTDGFSTVAGVINITVERSDTTPPVVSIVNVPNKMQPGTVWYNTDLTVTLTATDTGSGVQDMTYSASGARVIPATTTEEATHQFVLGEEGITTIAARATDNMQNTSAVRTKTLRIDKQVPTVTAPVHAFDVTKRPLATSISMTLSWTGVDTGGSGLSRYILQRSTNGGEFTTISGSALTATTFAITVNYGTTYQFRVQALDRAGNASDYATGETFLLNASQQDADNVTQSNGWTDATLPGAFGGSVIHSSTREASVSIEFEGTRVAWVSTKQNSGGLADVLIDGVRVRTVDLYKGFLPQTGAIVFISDVLAPGRHTLTVNVLGVGSTSSSGARVDVDGFIITPTDHIPPTVTAPEHALAFGSQVLSASAGVKLSWTGADAGGSEIRRFILQQSTNGAAFETVSVAAASTRTLSLAYDTTYQFRVRATDWSGNSSDWATSETFSLVPYQEDAASVTHAPTPGGWTTITRANGFGGTVKSSNTLDDTATFSFDGTRVAWVSTKLGAGGLAEVSIDGTVVQTVSLHKSGVATLVSTVFFSDVLAPGPHTLTIRVLGPNSTPQAGTRVDIDGFIVIPAVIAASPGP